jgi:hypothetical protein
LMPEVAKGAVEEGATPEEASRSTEAVQRRRSTEGVQRE